MGNIKYLLKVGEFRELRELHSAIEKLKEQELVQLIYDIFMDYNVLEMFEGVKISEIEDRLHGFSRSEPGHINLDRLIFWTNLLRYIYPLLKRAKEFEDYNTMVLTQNYCRGTIGL